MKNMNDRYRLIFHTIRGGMFYYVDMTTGKRTSLQTTDEAEARQLIAAKKSIASPARLEHADEQHGFDEGGCRENECIILQFSAFTNLLCLNLLTKLHLNPHAQISPDN
jgi:hypothetical protein